MKAEPPSDAVRRSRRRFTAEYKLRIVKEAEDLDRGSVAEILERESLDPSHLARWRAARERGELEGLGKAKPGRKLDLADLDKRVAYLDREFEILIRRLEELKFAVSTLHKLARSPRLKGSPGHPTATAAAGLMRQVEELAPITGVRDACKLIGLSRSTYYRLKSGGVHAGQEGQVNLESRVPPGPNMGNTYRR